MGDTEWHEPKAASNLKKHNLSFETAAEVFEDPFYLEKYDFANSSEEDRYRIIGRIKSQLVVCVVCTQRNGKQRIISARAAMAHEREAYYDRLRQLL